MEQEASKQGRGRRLLFLLKWIVLPLALVTILPLAALTLYEMTREVPAPESFQRFEAEQIASGGLPDLAPPDESLVDRDSVVVLFTPDNEAPQGPLAVEETVIPEFQSKPLIPISEDLPDDVEANELQRLNEAFLDLERRFAEYESNKDNYSFQDASNCMLPLYRETRMFEIEFNQKRCVKPLRRSDEGRLAADTAKDRISSFSQRFDPAFVDIGVRHEVWEVAGMFSRDWDEQVYYYRKCGAAKGSLHIGIALTRKGAGRVIEGIGFALGSKRRR
jgi:hypothetical protein